MVALVLTSMGSFRRVIDKILSARRDYQEFRFQEGMINLFLQITTPIGSKESLTDASSPAHIEIERLTFRYPNLAHYEDSYLALVKDHVGQLETRWMKEEFEDIITKLEEAKSFTPSTILTDVNLVMECGKVYGIVGKNGAGKTTLMHLIAGFFRGYDGRIGLMGEKDTREWKPTLFAEQVSFLAQVPFMMSW